MVVSSIREPSFEEFQKKYKGFLTKRQVERIFRDMKPLPEMLTEWRVKNSLTKAQAARQCNMSAQLWGQLEAGDQLDPRSSTVDKLSEGTGLAADRIIKAAELARLAPAAL